jgi:hypothetical protein
MLAFTSFYFSESGLFNGLRPIQIKFFPPSPIWRPSAPCSTLIATDQAGFNPAKGKCITRISAFSKELQFLDCIKARAIWGVAKRQGCANCMSLVFGGAPTRSAPTRSTSLSLQSPRPPALGAHPARLQGVRSDARLGFESPFLGIGSRLFTTLAAPTSAPRPQPSRCMARTAIARKAKARKANQQHRPGRDLRDCAQRVDGEFGGQEMARGRRMYLIPKQKLVLIGRVR